jgi:hypothetical protein
MGETWNWKPDRLFSLSYVPPSRNGKEKRPPELVIGCDAATGREAEELILARKLHVRSDADYLKGLEDLWSSRQPDLFPTGHEGRFGFGGCGYVREEEGLIAYHLPLAHESVRQTAYTLHLLTFALDCLVSGAMKREAVSNRAQLASVTTICDNHAHAGYGHAVTGHIYPAFRRWMIRYALEHAETRGHVPQAEEAMRQVYGAVAPSETREYAEDCCARIGAEGRFYLTCFGNACDLAIYPDSDHSDREESPTNFSCHNLDTVFQQLTLLAGFAVLQELAAEDVG